VNERPETLALLAALRYDYDAVRRELDLLNDIELVVLRGASLDLQLDIAVLLEERARGAHRFREPKPWTTP
jgi:alkylhydroperoxidase family enzyme